MEARARRLSLLERALQLKALDAFRDLPPDELGVVARHAREREFRAGARLFRAGERAGSFHLVVEGRVSADGAELADAHLEPPAAVGLLSLLAEWDEGLEAVAETDTLTLEIGAEDLHDVLEDHFPIYMSEVRTLARRTSAFLAGLADGAPLGRVDVPPLAPSDDLDLIQRLLIMRKTAAFRRANMDALIELARRVRIERAEPGTTLWRLGDASGHTQLVLAGRVRCERDDGRLLWAGPGTPLGNLESLASDPRWFTAVVAQPALLLRTDTDRFLDVLEDHFEMALGYLAALAEGLIRRSRAAMESAAPAA